MAKSSISPGKVVPVEGLPSTDSSTDGASVLLSIIAV